jgi:hypothetical protein
MRANKVAKNLLRKTRLNCQLVGSLKNIADNGFYCLNGCYVFRGLPGGTNVKISNFPDNTGYECFMNSLHIEDCDTEVPFAQAMLFVVATFESWNFFHSDLTLMAIVSANDQSVVTKFHVRRLREQWLSEDIEDYDDPVLTLDSNEDVASVLMSI